MPTTRRIHFLDAATGERTRPDFTMGDIIKGSVTLDPDGFPLLYVGSRDPNYRVIALDGDAPTRAVVALRGLGRTASGTTIGTRTPVIAETCS